MLVNIRSDSDEYNNPKVGNLDRMNIVSIILKYISY